MKFGSETNESEAITTMKTTRLNHAAILQSPKHCHRFTKIFRLINAPVVFLMTSGACLSQTPPFLSLTKPSATQLKLSWTAQPGTNYQCDFSEELDAFALWSPLGSELVASSNSLHVTFTQPTNAMELYRVRSLPDDGFPQVAILSPTNGATVSGTVQIQVSARDDRRLSSVTLYLDGEPLQTKTEGDLIFTFETAHYPNGVYEIYAVARDNIGISELGGSPSASVIANETQSPSHFLTFANSLRWTNADHLFDSGVSILAESDVFPTDYTVYVEDASGSTVRIFTEQTLDGQIQTYWDGLDGLGNPVSVEQQYTITLALEETSASTLIASASRLSSSTDNVSNAQWVANAYGYEDFIVTKQIETTIAPPLPPIAIRKNRKIVFEAQPSVTAAETTFRQVTQRYSYRKLAQTSPTQATTTSSLLNATQGKTANASDGAASVSSKYWKEAPWSSGEILLARQVLSEAPTLWNTQIANMLNNIANQVAIAEDSAGNGRGVYQNLRMACSTPNDYEQLLNLLTQPTVRNLYYSGHSSGNSIGYSDSVPNNGITMGMLAKTLTNQVVFPSDGSYKFEFRKPFRFVFIDGCSSANGSFSYSFGIPSTIKNPYKSRAFMGWNITVRSGLLNTDHRLFTERFWTRWVGDEDYDKTLRTAINQALASTPSVTANTIVVFGTDGLTWGN